MKLIYKILLLVLIIASCNNSNDNIEEIIIVATNISTQDLGNSGGSSDIRVTFTKPESIENISVFRLIITKSELAEMIDVETALSFSSDSYLSIDSDIEMSVFDFPDGLLDSDGDQIIEGTSYKAIVLSISADQSIVQNQLSKPSNEIILRQENVVKTLVEGIKGGSGGVAVDKNDNLYMADFGQTLGGPPGDKVFKITPSGTVSVFATGLVGASGNDFDSNGNLFQSNISGQSISKITPEGDVSVFVSGDPIVNTVGISIDSNDDLFVADCDGHKIIKVDKEGEMSIHSSSFLLRCPNGLTRDENDNLYASNFYNGDVIKITPDKEASVLVTLPGNNNGHITYHNGFLYVIARTANQIYKVSLTGEAELFAGSGERGKRDGGALNATFSLPNDLIFSNDGTKLYINDVVPLSGGDIAPCNIRVIDLANNE